jgi:hypothetical protein
VKDGDNLHALRADRHIIECAPGRTIAIRLHVSFLSSLLQRLGAQLRQQRRGAFGTTGNPAVARFAASCPPIEILRWGEYAARDAAELADVAPSVQRRADVWAADLTAAMQSMANEYWRGFWPEERTALLDTQRWLIDKLPAIKDDVITGMRRGLALAEDDRPVDVVLVRQTYDIVGAHSHPALVDTSRFVGADLVEVLFHEIGHELLDRNIGLEGSAIAILDGALGKAASSQVNVYDLLHVAMFAQIGDLIARYFQEAHLPLIYRNGRLTRLLRQMRVTAPEPDVIVVLRRHAAGQIELDELARLFTSFSAGPR